jgi:hypothetical protein
MPMFRKKPVVIEANRFDMRDLEQQEHLAAWCYGKLCGYTLYAMDRVIKIQTLEGEIEASFGDWIIKGVKSEFYPCKPDIFDLTYEAVNDD